MQLLLHILIISTSIWRTEVIVKNKYSAFWIIKITKHRIRKINQMLSSASFSLNNFANCKYCYKEQRSSFGEHDNSESMWKLSKWDKKMESEQGDKNIDKAAQKLKENKRQSNQILSLPVSFNKANISVSAKCLGS